MTEQEYKRLKRDDKIIFTIDTSPVWRGVVGILTDKDGDGWYVKLPYGTNGNSIDDTKYFDTTISIYDIEHMYLLTSKARKSHLPKWF